MPGTFEVVFYDEYRPNTPTGLLDSTFTHDVYLVVNGEFESDYHKLEYCNALADKLNGV